ncbi:hypothetical protein C8J56DRAFT_1023368 [Mycena floridula]|nr:hypothetical protein C8J56DRAFT_1023368 [Mycena floridula]
MLLGLVSLCSLYYAVAAQDITSLLGALTDLKLTKLASALQSAANGDSGLQLALSSSQSKTLFAPNDDAFSEITSPSSGYFLYHIAWGNWTQDNLGTGANHSILTTALSGHQLSFLEADKPQVLACGVPRSPGGIEVYNQAQTTNVLNTIFRPDLQLTIHIINHHIDLPLTYSTLIQVLAVKQFSNTQISAGISNNELDSDQGYTIFAFTDDAWSRDTNNGHLSSLNASNIFNNHYIPRTTIWYNTFASSNYTSASGHSFLFSVDPSTKDYVITVGACSANIIHSDVLTNNGVIHVIDGTLWDNPAPSSTVSSTSASPSSTSGPTSNSSGSKHNSAGLIAGVVVGVVVLLAILGLLAFCVRKRKRHELHVTPLNIPPSNRIEPYESSYTPSFYTGPTSSGPGNALSPSSAIPSSTLVPLRKGEYPSSGPRTISSGASDSGQTNATSMMDIPEEMIDRVLERFAERIDRDRPIMSSTEPPAYRG